MIVLLLCALPAVGQLRDEDAAISQRSWRHESRCGPNCLLAYLKLHGGDWPAYQRLQELLPVTAEGVSLLQLRDVAERYGVPSAVLHVAPDELDQAGYPLIAHLKGQRGHFILVRRVDEKHVYHADPTTLEVGRWTRSEFAARASGYVLAPRLPLARIGGVCLAAFWVALAAAWWATLRRGRKKPCPS